VCKVTHPGNTALTPQVHRLDLYQCAGARPAAGATALSPRPRMHWGRRRGPGRCLRGSQSAGRRSSGRGFCAQAARHVRVVGTPPWHARSPLRSESSHLLAISGIGAFPILSAETGLHVFETPSPNRSFDRIAVRVAVAPYPSAAPGDRPCAAGSTRAGRVAGIDHDRPSLPHRAVSACSRLGDWRTGRLDRVLAGDFDVIADS
jgi:hypothetical protein